MRLREIYVRSNEKGRPPPEPEGGPGFLAALRACFDDATLGLRRRASTRIRQTINELDRGRLASLSDLHRAAAIDQLLGLRARIHAGGVDGLVASGKATLHCARLGPA